ncbi:DNA cytosine methyltransferase [Psychrobacter sp. I-STPA6b]|uniref:DNA cytosine methyltransferase n=1 Tax=Psychrobacter sp. I-STPA6b TaxID=2585718 RepID=UPI001D0C8A98|nr:DNA cytosine methyltransferase [Psychrobacter sp. I-STPA6b]
MKELSLFTGMGGGVYGSMILGWEAVAYVEKDEYCRQVIAQRIKDGWFDNGDIYGDIKEFNAKHAQKYAGQIDVLTGGFPCQPHSVAGKRKGASDERYLWDEIAKTIQIVRPRRLFFENVQGILTDSAIIDICRILESLDYRVKPPLLLGSDDCGNIHRRKRLWIFADSNSQRQRGRKSKRRSNEWYVSKQDKQSWSEVRSQAEGCAVREIHVADTSKQSVNASKCIVTKHTKQQKQEFGNSNQQNNSDRRSITSIEQLLQRADVPEPLFCRVDDELPDWRKQLKAIGNGQDPIVMATAYQILSDL